MEMWTLLIGLFLVTMLAFLAWALLSKKETEERLDDPAAPKSSLAKDGPGPNPVGPDKS